MQIVILGMHRSGTSMITRVINLMGAYVGGEGELMGVNRENLKGFWEREDVKQLNKHALDVLGLDWHRVVGFDRAKLEDPKFEPLKMRMRNVLAKLEPFRPWVIKEPRMSLVFPLWKDLLEVPVCVLIYRPPLEVAQSLRTRNGIPMSVGLALWEKYNLEALVNVRNIPSVVVSYNRIMRDPEGEIGKLHENLKKVGLHGLAVPGEREIRAAVDRQLHRERAEGNLDEFANGAQVKLYRALEKKSFARWKSIPDLSAGARSELESFESSLTELQRRESLLTEKHQALEAAEAGLHDLEKERGAREEKIRELSDGLEAMRGQERELEARHQELTKLLADRERRVQALQQQAEAFERERAEGRRQEEEVRRLREELEHSRAQIARYEGEVGFLSQAANHREEMLQAREREAEQLRMRIASEQARADAAFKETEELKNKLEQTGLTLQKAERETAFGEKALETLRSNLERQTRELREERELNKQRGVELGRLQDALQEKTAQHSELKALLEQAHARIEEISQRVAGAEKEKDSLRKDVEFLRGSLDKRDVELKKKEQDAVGLQERLERQGLDMEKLRGRLEDLRDALRSKESEALRLGDLHARAERELAKATEQADQLKDEAVQNLKLLEQKTSELTGVQNQLKQSENLSKEQVRAIGTLKTTLERRDQELEAREKKLREFRQALDKSRRGEQDARTTLEIERMRRQLQDAEQYGRHLANQIRGRTRDAHRLIHWIEELHRAIEATSQSKRWRIGDKLGGVAESLGLIPKLPLSATQHADLIMRDFQHWRRSARRRYAAAFSEPPWPSSNEISQEEMKAALVAMRNDVGSLEKTLKHRSRDVEELMAIVETLNRLLGAMIQSRRWKFGNRIGVAAERLHLIPRPRPMAHEHAEQIMAKYGIWKSQNREKKAGMLTYNPAPKISPPKRERKAGASVSARQQDDRERTPERSANVRTVYPLRINIVSPSTNIHGGTKRLLTIAKLLHERGHHVNFIRQFSSRPLDWFPLEAPVLDIHFSERTPPEKLMEHLPDAEILLTYGNNRAAETLDRLSRRKGHKFALFMHYGVHDRALDGRNARLENFNLLATTAWLAQEVGKAGRKVESVGFGVHDDQFFPVQAERGMRIGALYHRHEWKRTANVVEAFKRVKRDFPEAELVMFGQEVAPDLVDVPCEYHHDPDQAELRGIYSSCAVWVTASDWEGVGMCSVEAMLCRTPLVSTDNGGSRDFCNPENSVIVERDNVDALTEGIAKLLRDSGMARRLADRAYDDIRQWSWDRCIDRLEDICAAKMKNENPAFSPTRRCELSIGIPIHNQLDYVKECLRSVLENTDSEFEVILIDDQSDEPTREFIRREAERSDRIRYIRNDERKGFPYNCNLVLTHARGRYICILNSDTVVTRNWDRRLIDALKLNPHWAMAGPSTSYGVAKNYDRTAQQLEEVHGRRFEMGYADIQNFATELARRERADYLLEADLAVCTSTGGAENRYSFRTRLTDAVWSGIPIICTRHGFFGDYVESRDVGLTVGCGQAEELKRKIVQALEPETQDRFRLNLAHCRDELRWERCVEPLVDFCARVARGEYKRTPEPFWRPWGDYLQYKAPTLIRRIR